MLVVLILVAVVRFRLLDMPLERDEGEYAYAGQLILQGVPPYHLAYNMKFPGTYVAYAVIMALFGQTPAGIHFGMLCVTTLTALMLYWFGRRFFSELTGAVSATTYALLAASPQMLGLAGHATHFCALFVTAGLCLLWPFDQTVNWKKATAGGFMFGLAVIMKQPAALFCLWGLFFLGLSCWRRHEIPLIKRSQPCMAFCLGAALPFGLSCLILWRAGVFEQFWFWTVSYADKYVSIIPLAWAPASFSANFSHVIEKTALIWLVAVAGLILVWWSEQFRKVRLPLLGFVAASFLTTCPGFYFRPNYFLLVLPAVGILGGCAVNAVNQIRRQRAGSNSSTPIAWPVCAYWLILAITAFENRGIWFQTAPAEAARMIYFSNPFVESEAVSNYIRTNSPSDARVAVLGSEPQIYFLSRRHSATGYIYMYPLMEPQPFADRMQREMIGEIESAEPEYVIFTLTQISWLRRPESGTRLFEWWSHYRTNFMLVGIVAMDPPYETQYFWGADINKCPQAPENGILIYRRRIF
jgi:hypothetical protein